MGFGVFLKNVAMQVLHEEIQQYDNRIRLLVAERDGANKISAEYIVRLEKSEIHIKGVEDITRIRLKQIDILTDKLNTCKSKKKKADALETYWNTKITPSAIVYKGRSLPFSTVKCDVPVVVLITPNDPFIIKDLKKWGLYETGESSETLIPKIYKKIYYAYYKYKFDKNAWGIEEVWEFPFELRAKGITTGFDCDSWAHFQASYYIAAGVKEWLVRVVVGDTDLGGHSTVYTYSDVDNKWHHINSTYGKLSTTVSNFPIHKDARDGKDAIGINRVWFSFNNKYAWNKFADDLPKGVTIK